MTRCGDLCCCLFQLVQVGKYKVRGRSLSIPDGVDHRMIFNQTVVVECVGGSESQLNPSPICIRTTIADDAQIDFVTVT
ncbi:hypothetical protein L1887_10436 [Cichorium endivia]|nr:hypothetical protein L1887_10436 [Cichorium endivia]